MKPFDALTEHGRARRLRPLAWKALEFYDLPVRCLCLVTNSMNGIFRVDTLDCQKYILRVTAPSGGHIRDHVLAEMDWLAALRRDTNLSVPSPLPARDGSLVVEAAAAGVPEPRLCAIFSWVPGSDLAGQLSPANIAKLGELMARLHRHALTYSPPAGLDLWHFDKVIPFPEPVVLFEPEHADLFTPERRRLYEQAWTWAQVALDRLQACGEPMRILHNDLHQWNVRVSRGALSPIDFEDLMLGWPVQDIATTLYYFLTPDFAAHREAFRSGYTRRCAWPERYPGEVEAFIAARCLMEANYVLQDPTPEWSRQRAEFVVRIGSRLKRLMVAQPDN